MIRRFNNDKKTLNRFSSVTPREVIRDQNIVKRVRDRKATAMDSAGTYHLWFQRNLKDECHCRNRRNDTGHVRCPVCFGTGYLHSWEKFGYSTLTFAVTYPGLQMEGNLVQGWGYDEVFDTGTVLTTPFIDTTSFLDLALLQVDEFESTVKADVEVTYDDVNWFDVDDCLDFSHGSARFRLTLCEGMSRFLRLRFRTEEFTDTRDVDLPKDVYIQVSAAEKQSGDVSVTREKPDIVSEVDAWSLNKLQTSDFIVDMSGGFSGLRFSEGIPARYQVHSVRTGVHGPIQDEHERRFMIKYVPKNTYLHSIYAVPA